VTGPDPEKIKKIESLLRHHPRGLTISALSLKTRMNRNLLAKYLDVLHFSGHVEMQVTGTAKVYYLSHRVPISAMLEFSSDFIIVLDSDQKIIQANERILSLLHVERGDLSGQPITELSIPFFQELSRHVVPDGVKTRSEKPAEFSLAIDGRELFFSMKCVPTLFEDGSSGHTLILEDITGRKNAEEKIRTYMLQQEFFSQKLEEFAEIPPELDIYAAIGRGLDALLPEAIIDVNAYDVLTKTLQKKAVFGNRAEKFVARCAEHNCNWDASPAYSTVPALLQSGKVFHLPGKLHYASFEQITPESAEAIEREFNLGDFYSVGLVWRENFLGNILFVLRNGSTLSNIPFIEIYARAASIALQRQLSERAYMTRSGSAHTAGFLQQA